MLNSLRPWTALAAFVLTLSASMAAAPAQQQPPDAPQQESRSQVQTQSRPEIEQQRKDAESQAKGNLNKDAGAAIDFTRQALKAISENKPKDAIAAMEQATGRINTLMGRNPATALLPVEFAVDVIETAPQDVMEIRKVAKSAQTAFDGKDYPGARVLLSGLISEIRVRTYHLPLATYPAAMREATRLLDQNKMKEAGNTLEVALNTLVVVDRAKPLPLAMAQTAIQEADSMREKDKPAAVRMLSVARNELERSRELGYAGKDPEYTAIASAISDLETQLKGATNTQSAFARLKERIASFFKRQSESEKGAQVAGAT